ncbi:MAG: hypothetical protein JST01_20875 [Cyanobacteria bacterium SZAS TMP-1]|nr:hypothetical protein [Cyanobacteria bacterium SZAS TMP-1]
MQLRRFLSLFLTILALNLFSSIPVLANAAAEAETANIAEAASVETAADVPLPAAATEEAPVHFKAGVKYDPVKHQWLDRYSNKTVDLGLPGLNGKYGANQLLADASTSTTTTTTVGGFPWKKFIIITVMIAGVATAIVVPIVLGVHHHNNNANTQNNQAAAYYFFHNQTLPIPTVPHGPNPFVPSGGEKPPPQGDLLRLLMGK